jgi:hypothetical protein
MAAKTFEELWVTRRYFQRMIYRREKYAKILKKQLNRCLKEKEKIRKVAAELDTKLLQYATKKGERKWMMKQLAQKRFLITLQKPKQKK